MLILKYYQMLELDTENMQMMTAKRKKWSKRMINRSRALWRSIYIYIYQYISHGAIHTMCFCVVKGATQAVE